MDSHNTGGPENHRPRWTTVSRVMTMTSSVYGLPELNRRAICHSKHVANPGCFATCIQLGLLPLAKHLLLNEDVMVNAITGSTGAGVKLGATSHFSWRNNNMSIYKPFSSACS